LAYGQRLLKLRCMFLRCDRRTKDGKLHEYWSVVENRRVGDGRVVQRQVLYLGEINACNPIRVQFPCHITLSSLDREAAGR
jgi:hypothetical protein